MEIVFFTVFFMTLQASHRGKGDFFWIDEKRRVLIVDFLDYIQVTFSKKHGGSIRI